MNLTNQYTDCEIIEKVLAGQTALYEIIIRRYNAYLYKTGRSYGFNFEDTEDLMQDTYISAYTSLQKFENRASFKTWLVRIMLSHCYHKKNKSAYKNEFLTDKLNENALPMFSNDNPDAQKSLINRELGRALETALINIPEDYRLVFSLRELSGLNTAETAEALRISEGNVKIRLSRAKNFLKNEIEKLYSPEDIFDFNLIYCDRIVENVMRRIVNL